METFNSCFKSISNRKYNTWCNYILRLDTYGCGCQHNCKYCYAKGLLNFRKHWDNENPKPSNMVIIYKSIKQLDKYSIVKIGGMTDCFMPLEKEIQNTYLHRMACHFIKVVP